MRWLTKVRNDVTCGTKDSILWIEKAKGGECLLFLALSGDYTENFK